MAKCLFSWPAQLQMVKIFEIGHEMTNLATLRSNETIFCFQEHSAPPRGDLNFKQPYLGNRCESKFLTSGKFLTCYCLSVNLLLRI